VKEFLSRAGHAFETKNIEEDAAAYDELIARGALSVPLTVIGDRQITGYDQAKLREALAVASAGSSPDR
jgi:glutaredoxin-like protein NrdH